MRTIKKEEIYKIEDLKPFATTLISNIEISKGFIIANHPESWEGVECFCVQYHQDIDNKISNLKKNGYKILDTYKYED